MSEKHGGKKLMNKNNAVSSIVRSQSNSGKTRNKFLLRRTFKAWRESTFGRLSPSHAREYYQKRLKSQCLAILKTSHKNSRKEWKLWIRAEYHDRFRVWQFYFKRWSTYVYIAQHKRKQSQLAIGNANKTLLKNCWYTWMVFVVMQKRQKKLVQCSTLHYNTSVTRKIWKLWLHRFNNECLLKDMNYVALNHWAMSVVNKAFLVWRNRYLDNCDLQKKIAYCEAFYNQKVAAKAITRWKLFMEICEENKRLKALADDILLKTLFRVSFKQWKTSYELQVHIREEEEYIIEHGKKSIKRRYFNQLLKYRRQRIQVKQMLNNAALTYETNLKKHCLIHLKRYMKEYKQKELLKETASKFLDKKISSRCFSLWMNQCEHREDLKQYPLSKIAYQYFRSRVLFRSLFCWTQYVKIRKQKASMYQLALLHHNKRLLPRCFTAWIKFCETETDTRQMHITALQFYRELLLSKSYFTWVKCFKIALFEKDLQEQAVMHYNHFVLRSTFTIWKHQMERLQFMSKLEITAVTHFNNHLSRTYFLKWIVKNREAISLKLKWKKSTDFYMKTLKRRHCSALKQHWCVKKNRKAKYATSMQFYNHKILKIVVKSWKELTDKAKKINSLVEDRYKQNGRMLCSWVLTQWHFFVEESKTDRRKQEISLSHYQHWLLQSAFTSFRVYTSKRIQSKYAEDESIVRAQVKIQKGLLKTLFIKWRLRSDVSCHERINSIAAFQHHRRITSRKIFRHWRMFVLQSYKSKVMTSHCMAFYTLNTEKRFFQVWKAKYEIRCVENHESNVSIWWWSYRLQMKVFSNMRKYANEKRQKKLLYKQALNFRTEILIETGVIKWLQYSTSVMDRRRRIACEENIKNSITLQARVRLYALRWLHKTRQTIERQRLSHPINIERNVAQPIPNLLQSTIRCTENVSSINSNSYKPFDVQIPAMKKRPTPRLPEYLRESFDLRRFWKQNPLTIRNTFNEHNPRTDTHAPVAMEITDPRWSTDSARALTVTDDEETSAITHHSKSKEILMPPSCFQKKTSGIIMSLKP